MSPVDPVTVFFLCARSFTDLCMWQWQDTLVSFWQPMWRPQRFGRCRFWLYMFLFRICYNLTDLTCYDFSSCRIYSPALQIFIRAIFVKTSWFLRCGNCRERTAVLAVVKYKRRLQELQGDQFSVTKHHFSLKTHFQLTGRPPAERGYHFLRLWRQSWRALKVLCFLHVFPWSSRNLPERQCKRPKLLRSIHQFGCYKRLHTVGRHSQNVEMLQIDFFSLPRTAVELFG